MEGWMGAWAGEWMDGWEVEWMNGKKEGGKKGHEAFDFRSCRVCKSPRDFHCLWRTQALCSLDCSPRLAVTQTDPGHSKAQCSLL